MFQIDPLGLVPQSIKDAVLDTTVDFLSSQAKKLLGDEIAAKIKKLRTDASFHQSFEKGLKRALERFKLEYEEQDEDMVTAITVDPSIFKDEKFQATLLEMIKRPGTYLDEEREKIVSSFELILPGRKNRQRVDRAISYLLRCIVEELWHLPELQPIYSLQFQRMTAEATRQQVEIQKAQLQALTELNVGIRQSLLQLTDALANNKFLPDGRSTEISQQSKVIHNLPNPEYGQFVGRDKELAQLLRLLRPYPYSQHSVITIDGIGGIGKSTLALEVAYRYLRNYDQIPTDERFDAIIWVSAKQNYLTADGIKLRAQSFRTLQDIFSTVAFVLNWEAINRTKNDEQLSIVSNVLSRQRTLLIIDNLETIDDETVTSFLRELPAPTKAIITTRHRIDVAYSIRLKGMQFDDAYRLISNECGRRSISPDRDRINLLYERTGGIPLAIIWSIARIQKGYPIEAVLADLGKPSNDITRYCFENLINDLHERASYNTLLALSMLPTHCIRNVVGIVVGVPEYERDDALVELETYSLINRAENKFIVSSLVKQYCRQELKKLQEQEKNFKRAYIDYYSNFLIENRQLKYDSLNTVAPEIDNILNIIDWCNEDNLLDTSIKMTLQVEFYIWSIGRWEEWMKYIELAKEASIIIGDELSEAELLVLLASMKDFLDDIDEGIIYVNRAIRIYREHNNQKGLALSLWRLGSLKIHQEDYESAMESLNEGLVIAERVGDKRNFIRIQRRIAVLEMKSGNLESARNLLEKAKQLREEDGELSSGLGYNYRLLGQVAFLEGRYETALDYYQQSLEMGEKTNLSGVADAKYCLAELHYKLGNNALAHTLGDEAVTFYKRMGMKRETRRAIEFLSQFS